MHAGFPTLGPELCEVISRGARDVSKLPEFAEALGGQITSVILAEAIKIGFGVVLLDTFILKDHGKKSREFFEKNFVITDPNAPGGERFYQGRFLIRTRKPGDELNVWFGFCQDPEEVYPNFHDQRVSQAEESEELAREEEEKDAHRPRPREAEAGGGPHRLVRPLGLGGSQILPRRSGGRSHHTGGGPGDEGEELGV